MGTRNLVCVFYKGAFVIAQYGQYDGYPSGQGTTIFKFLRIPINIHRLKEGLEHIYKPPEQQICQATREISNLRGLQLVAWQYFTNYPIDSWHTRKIMKYLSPSLDAGTGAGILEVVACASNERKVPVSLNLDFATDIGSCEWVYVIDLDEEVLEIFTGHVKKVPGHRFVDIGDDKDYVPCLMSSILFSELLAMDENQFRYRVRENEENEE